MFNNLLFSLLILSTLIYGQGVADAQGYHKNSDQQWRASMRIIEPIVWEGDEKVLDVGCGDGKITAHIAKTLSSGAVVGIDISESMIRFASNHYNDANHRNLIFLKADASYLPFEEQFDIITSFSTLHWVINQENALKSLHKALVPGGKIYIVTCGKAPMNLAKLSENLIYSEKWAPYFKTYYPQRVYFTETEYRDLLHKARFTQVEVTSNLSQTIYPNRKALIDFVSPVLNFVQHLSPELQDQFINEVADQIISLSKPTIDGSIIFEVLNLEATATK